MARDARSLTVSRYHEIEDCNPITEDIKAAVRRVVCANAEGDTLDDQVSDAIDLMGALGVLPGAEAEDSLLTSVPSIYLGP